MRACRLACLSPLEHMGMRWNKARSRLGAALLLGLEFDNFRIGSAANLPSVLHHRLAKPKRNMRGEVKAKCIAARIKRDQHMPGCRINLCTLDIQHSIHCAASFLIGVTLAPVPGIVAQ